MVAGASSDGRHAEQGIDVVLRFHDPTRLLELGRAVFSLVGQTYRPIRILLVLQRFTDAEVEATLAALGPLLAWAEDIELVPLRYQRDQPEDARSELLAMGFAAASGRFLALLDYDDVLYPEAYQLLIDRLHLGNAAIAFARTPVVKASLQGTFLHALDQSSPFTGTGLADLFTANFCPIHSYVIDRSRMPDGLLRIEPSLTQEEDYDLLLRLCATVPSDFARLDSDIGLYFVKTDGSNSFDRTGSLTADVLARIADAAAFIEARRRLTLLAPDVQRSLGIDPPERGLTVRRWLDRRAATRGPTA